MINNYLLEYDIIPSFIEEVKSEKLNYYCLQDKLFFQMALINENTSFDFDEFKIEVEDHSDNSMIVKYIFPKPEDVPEAKYGVVFINMKSKQIAYYTLELTYNESDDDSERFVVGSVPSLGSHINHGEYNLDVNIDSFVEHVKNIFIDGVNLF